MNEGRATKVPLVSYLLSLMSSKKYFTIIILLVPLLFALPHTARAVSWFPLVPCGLNAQPKDSSGVEILKSVHDYTQDCNQCLLIELGKNVIDMTFFAIVPAVGTLLFMIAGFIILFNARSGNASGVTKGKEIMTNTAIGIAIILSSWLITNFILKSIAVDQVAGVPWYQIQCRTGSLKDIVVGTAPQPPVVPPIVPPVTQKYSCNASNTCVADSSGQYTTNTCDGKCSAPAGGVLVIATASLTDATQNAAYSQALSVIGGIAPYTWALFTTTSSRGVLPAGLVLTVNGEIKGIPTATGNFTFMVQVNDSNGEVTADKEFTIKVNSASTGGTGGGGGTGTGGACGGSGQPACPPGGGTGTGTKVTYGTCTGVACSGDTTNICSPVDPGDGCDVSAVNNLNAAIVAGVGNRTICGGIDTVKLLKTIIANESDGRIDIGSGDGQSAGPFQLTADTAKRFSQGCGVGSNEVIDFKWLQNAATVSKQACIAAQFIKSFVGSCGCDVRQLAAGYNGGPTACAASNACGQQAAANGGQCIACNQAGPTRKWECLWEDTQHNSCNKARPGGGYSHTRIYAPRVEYCYNKF